MAFKVFMRTDEGDGFMYRHFQDGCGYKTEDGGVLIVKVEDGSVLTYSPSAWLRVEDGAPSKSSTGGGFWGL